MKTFRQQINANGMMIGIIMKEAVRRALIAIRNELHVMEIMGKLDYAGEEGDVVTTCDLAAQKKYVKVLMGCFPGIGIIAEENNLRVECTLDGVDAYFTIDAVDGTKALTRLQSKGIGTMLSLVVNGKIIAVFIGDVMTKEIYGYRPVDSDAPAVDVNRISEFEVAKVMQIDPDRKLSDQYVLLRDRLEDHSPFVQRLVRRPEDGGLFKNLQIEGGSIGIGMAQLWKGEVGAAILGPAFETPWDSSPVWGICQQMGFEAYAIDPDGNVDEFQLTASKEVVRRDNELMVVHESRRDELAGFLPTIAGS